MVAQRIGMDGAVLGRLLADRLPDLCGDDGLWHAEADGVDVFVIADEEHDRMRIMVPLFRLGAGEGRLLSVLLSANFDRALDARYALRDDVVWAIFLHHLSWLTERELDDGLRQVLMLARTTGTTFASSNLYFGAPPEEE